MVAEVVVVVVAVVIVASTSGGSQSSIFCLNTLGSSGSRGGGYSPRRIRSSARSGNSRGRSRSSGRSRGSSATLRSPATMRTLLSFVLAKIILSAMKRLVCAVSQ